MRLARGRTVAVLGAGIMGSSVALLLARRGVRVLLLDADDRPFDGASRWNEGKIHLGYLYGADPTLRTARKLLPGGLAFPRLLRSLVDIDLAPLTTPADDRYVVHRDSVVGVEDVAAVAERVGRLAAGHPDADDYFVPLSRHGPRRLARSELAAYDPSLVTGGIAVPERSVATPPVADAFVEALDATTGIELLPGHLVTAVDPTDDDRWTVQARRSDGTPVAVGPLPVVVNALWQGRPAVDVTAGLPPPTSCTHRYRVSVFARAAAPVGLASSVVAVGPFGDVKNYDGRDLYVSWYPTGLLAEGEQVVPPATPHLGAGEAARLASRVLRSLGEVIPEVAALESRLATTRVRGGWVYADGTGPLDRADSDLHRRDRVGVTRRGGYVSVDTGKYSIAPWLAERLVADLLGD